MEETTQIEISGQYLNSKFQKKNIVYVNGIPAPYGKFYQKDYSWGYKGDGPISLAMAIREVLVQNYPSQYFNYGKIYVYVSELPKGESFTRVEKLERFI